MYKRKTYDEYAVQGDYGYGYGYETISTETTSRQAREQLKAYRENEPGVRFRIVKKRIKFPI